jgi:hypothetical protein
LPIGFGTDMSGMVIKCFLGNRGTSQGPVVFPCQEAKIGFRHRMFPKANKV